MVILIVKIMMSFMNAGHPRMLNRVRRDVYPARGRLQLRGFCVDLTGRIRRRASFRDSRKRKNNPLN